MFTHKNYIFSYEGLTQQLLQWNFEVGYIVDMQQNLCIGQLRVLTYASVDRRIGEWDFHIHPGLPLFEFGIYFLFYF